MARLKFDGKCPDCGKDRQEAWQNWARGTRSSVAEDRVMLVCPACNLAWYPKEDNLTVED